MSRVDTLLAEYASHHQSKGNASCQGIGHAVFEKKAPSFLTNLIHLMVGPLFLLNETLRARRIALVEKGA